MATAKDRQVLFLQRSTARKTILASLLAASLLTGCQRRAYTDLYVDSMAAEIRDLEDQLYQYDHEYRLLEQELESLRRRKAMQGPQYDSVAPLEAVPKQKPKDPVTKPNDKSGDSSRSGSKPKTDSQPSTTPNTSESPASPPSILNQSQPFQFPAPTTDNLPAPNRTTPPGSGSSSDSPANTNSPGDSRSPKSESTDLDFNAGELIVPTITTGALAPPSLDVGQRSATPDRDLELSLSQIELPSQLTVGRNNSAKITTAVQVVTDKRIVELAFHPALSRAVSFDDDNQDDGLYLVLQPKNEQGQVVAIPGAIVVELYDPSRDAANAAIGRWSYSAVEVEGKIQPIGSKQGIHLTLPWNGPNPKSDRVAVVVTMQLENGRKVIGKREIFLNSGNGLKTVWTPRANRGDVQPAAGFAPAGPKQLDVGPGPNSAVIRASAEIAAPSSSHGLPNGNHPVQSVGSYPAPESAPTPKFER